MCTTTKSQRTSAKELIRLLFKLSGATNSYFGPSKKLARSARWRCNRSPATSQMDATKNTIVERRKLQTGLGSERSKGSAGSYLCSLSTYHCNGRQEHQSEDSAAVRSERSYSPALSLIGRLQVGRAEVMQSESGRRLKRRRCLHTTAIIPVGYEREPSSRSQV